MQRLCPPYLPVALPISKSCLLSWCWPCCRKEWRQDITAKRFWSGSCAKCRQGSSAAGPRVVLARRGKVNQRQTTRSPIQSPPRNPTHDTAFWITRSLCRILTSCTFAQPEISHNGAGGVLESAQEVQVGTPPRTNVGPCILMRDRLVFLGEQSGMPWA